MSVHLVFMGPKSPLRWSLAALGGIVYGIVVVVCAVTQWS